MDPGNLAFAASTLALLYFDGPGGLALAAWLFGASVCDTLADWAATEARLDADPKTARTARPARYVARLASNLLWPALLVLGTVLGLAALARGSRPGGPGDASGGPPRPGAGG